jgi:hypothetical protein
MEERRKSNTDVVRMILVREALPLAIKTQTGRTKRPVSLGWVFGLIPLNGCGGRI